MALPRSREVRQVEVFRCLAIPPHVVQEQHKAVSPCEFKYQKLWYSVPRTLPHCSVVYPSSWQAAVHGGLGGASGRLGCVGLSPGKLNPVVSP